MDATEFERIVGQTPADFAQGGWSIGKLLNTIWDHSDHRGDKVPSLDLASEAAALLELEGLPMTLTTLTPEEQIDETLARLLELVEGREVPNRMGSIRAVARRLDALWKAYQRSELLSVTGDFEDIRF